MTATATHLQSWQMPKLDRAGKSVLSDFEKPEIIQAVMSGFAQGEKHARKEVEQLVRKGMDKSHEFVTKAIKGLKSKGFTIKDARLRVVSPYIYDVMLLIPLSGVSMKKRDEAYKIIMDIENKAASDEFSLVISISSAWGDAATQSMISDGYEFYYISE